MLSIFLTVALQLPQPPTDAAAVPRLSQAEFRTLHSAGDVLVIDVRSHAIFQDGRIPGAMSVPLAEIEPRLDAIRARTKGRRIVTYCSCPVESSAAEAALALYRHGFKQVSALVGGFPDWVAAGGRVEKGDAHYLGLPAPRSARPGSLPVCPP
jgi:rhodanese-related sulfurtransferase